MLGTRYRRKGIELMKIFRIWIAIAALVGGMPVWAQQLGSPFHGSHEHMWGGGWYGVFLGPLMMLLFLGIAVAVIVLIVRWLGGSGHHAHMSPPGAAPGKTPVDILKERFARGEIDKQEFEERKRVLDE
jgi:putative membrane protein